jgi:hypothetical protein
MKVMEKNLKTCVSNKVSIVQSMLSSKARGLRTFVVNVAHSLGQRLSALETKTTPAPPATEVRIPALDHEDQDAEIELRLLKWENPNHMTMRTGSDALSRLPTDQEGMAAFVEA